MLPCTLFIEMSISVDEYEVFMDAACYNLYIKLAWYETGKLAYDRASEVRYLV